MTLAEARLSIATDWQLKRAIEHEIMRSFLDLAAKHKTKPMAAAYCLRHAVACQRNAAILHELAAEALDRSQQET
jgi:hypothetical protein